MESEKSRPAIQERKFVAMMRLNLIVDSKKLTERRCCPLAVSSQEPSSLFPSMLLPPCLARGSFSSKKKKIDALLAQHGGANERRNVRHGCFHRSKSLSSSKLLTFLSC